MRYPKSYVLDRLRARVDTDVKASKDKLAAWEREQAKRLAKFQQDDAPRLDALISDLVKLRGLNKTPTRRNVVTSSEVRAVFEQHKVRDRWEVSRLGVDDSTEAPSILDPADHKYAQLIETLAAADDDTVTDTGLAALGIRNVANI